MTPPSEPRCLSCERPSQEVPLMTWHYQERDLWLCPDCLPRLIHRRAELEDRLGPASEASSRP